MEKSIKVSYLVNNVELHRSAWEEELFLTYLDSIYSEPMFVSKNRRDIIMKALIDATFKAPLIINEKEFKTLWTII